MCQLTTIKEAKKLGIYPGKKIFGLYHTLLKVQTPSLCLPTIMSGLKNEFRYANLTVCLFLTSFSQIIRGDVD